MKRALVVGRFQPYHLGHHEAIKNILKEVDEVIIVIGTCEQSYELDNPFTTGERIEMISHALKDEGIFDKCYIIPVRDIKEYSLWTSHVKSYTPKFDVVYSNNPVVEQLFESEGMPVHKMKSNLKEIDSTSIRKAIIEENDWHKMIPKVVHDYLLEINAKDRLKAIIKEEIKE